MTTKTTKTTKTTEQTKLSPWVVGTSYLIRTVTHYWVGRLVAVYSMELEIDNATWVADTGDFATALKTGRLEIFVRVEGLVSLGRGAIVDALPWAHPLVP